MDETTYLYRLFGLRAAANRPIPGLNLATDSTCEPDFTIVLGCRPQNETAASIQSEKLVFASTALNQSDNPALRIYSSDALTHVICDDHTQFWFDKEGANIWGIWSDPHQVDDAATYLLGPVLGLVLSQRGVTCLHASAVGVRGKAVLFSGEAGAGKSTTAAAMACRGHAILADDIVAIRERHDSFYANPAYPYLSLWRDSAEFLCGSDTELSTFSPSFPKHRLPLGNTFHGYPLPLGTIFILGERASENRNATIERLAPPESLLALVANSYATKVLDPQARASEFRFFGRMLSSVPVLRVHSHNQLELIEDLCEMIERRCD